MKLSKAIECGCCNNLEEKGNLIRQAEELENKLAIFKMLYRQSRLNTETGVDANIELDEMVGNIGLRVIS